ncbi:unnamed protein product [Schistocephalus solidus]|uniref:Uncharacterized protein n=1 Tax=Schistocephalus solidus TaxID=70667 RepID=A0A3P7DJ60_SCHSO|nr:unnamed protein product [Schistocephalus solidus]
MEMPLKVLKNVEKKQLSVEQNKKHHVILLSFTNITDLDLSNNDLEELPLLSTLKFLKNLNLRNNRLEKIPPISNCTQLIKLDLSGNFLTDLSTASPLPELRQLYLQSNCLTAIDGKLVVTATNSFPLL